MAALEATRDYCLTIRTPAKAGRAKRMRMDCLPWVHERPTLSSNQKGKNRNLLHDHRFSQFHSKRIRPCDAQH
jgi:hypothetical protein